MRFTSRESNIVHTNSTKIYVTPAWSHCPVCGKQSGPPTCDGYPSEERSKQGASNESMYYSIF